MLHKSTFSLAATSFKLILVAELLSSIHVFNWRFEPHKTGSPTQLRDSTKNDFNYPIILLAEAKGVAGLGKAGGENSGGSDKSGQQVPPEVYIALTYAGTAFLFTLSVPLILYGLNKLLNKVEDCFGCGPSTKRRTENDVAPLASGMVNNKHACQNGEQLEPGFETSMAQSKNQFPSASLMPDNRIILEAIQKLHLQQQIQQQQQQQQQTHQTIQHSQQLPFASSLTNSLSLTIPDTNYKLSPSQQPGSIEQ